MSVDPINDQASSRYVKSETTTMKLLLLFMFVAVTVESEEPDAAWVESFSNSFNITREQSTECIKKTGVTREDVDKMADSVKHSERKIADMKSLKTASCAWLCGAQKQGTVVGKEIQVEQMFKDSEVSGGPKDMLKRLRDTARFCKGQAADTEDECMMFYRFTKCMHINMRYVLEVK